MKKDERIRQLAENVLKNSVKLKKGEQIYIEAIGASTMPLMQEFINVATKMGGVPFYYYNDESMVKEFFKDATEQQAKAHAEIHRKIMAESQVYIAIRGYDDLFEMSELDAKQMALYQKYYWQTVHTQTRIVNTRWCVMRYPNCSLAAMSKMSVKDFEDFYFGACLLDYAKMGQEMKNLKKLMDKTKKVRIIKAPDTDLEFSIEGLKAVISAGGHNIPDGEVYTAPVKNSINGKVQFNTETSYFGAAFSNIALEFEAGKIVKATSSVNNDKLQEIINIDVGARYMGEFAIGLNPYIDRPIVDILFDEKIGGSFHMAIGNSYEDETHNGNKSAIHWDLVQMQDQEHGGGEIWFDDVLIRKDGRFMIAELLGLNQENLK